MKDLVEIIKNNPGCIATIDNDCWWIHRAPDKPIDDMTDEEHDHWREAGVIAESGEVVKLGEGYGSGNLYGGDILQALAVIVGIKIQSV